MTTAQTLVDDAFIECRKAGSLVNPTTAERTIGLRFLNRIIGRLSAQQIYIPYSTSENFAISSSSQSYTMGSGGTASSTRARKITNCYIRDSASNDYPVEIISETDWNRIYLKTTTGRPYKLFYDPVYATGVIYFYYKPDTSYTAYIESMKDLNASLGLNDTLALPSEYEDALVLTLAHKLSRAFGYPNEGTLLVDSQEAWKEISVLNISQRVPRAKLPFTFGDNSEWLFTGSNS